MEDQLIIFLKAPRLGQVKTRLAVRFGEPETLTAYHFLVRHLLDNLEHLPPVQLRFTPDNAADEVKTWRRNIWTLAPQGTGTLGERLERAFQESFDLGARRVVIIGSDCPDVTSEDIQTAWCSLTTHDVVLGPATDGGYWLIGLRSPQPTLFHGIAWSTEQVLEQTLKQASSVGLSVHLIKELADIDTTGDWLNYISRWLGYSS